MGGTNPLVKKQIISILFHLTASLYGSTDTDIITHTDTDISLPGIGIGKNTRYRSNPNSERAETATSYALL